MDALPPAGAVESMHWHQMADTREHLDPQALAVAHAFTWQILKEIDKAQDRGGQSSARLRRREVTTARVWPLAWRLALLGKGLAGIEP